MITTLFAVVRAPVLCGEDATASGTSSAGRRFNVGTPHSDGRRALRA
jgi:hypothetical protein